MTSSLKKCAVDGFLIIYLLICTFVANGYCDNNFNRNDKGTSKAPFVNPHEIGVLRENQIENQKLNQIDFSYLTSVVDQQSKIKNYTANTNAGWDNIQCRCNTTDLPSESTSIIDCNSCINSENEISEQHVGNNRLFKLNYSPNKVNETIYLNFNFENLTDRQRRDVIDESSTSTNGLHGKWY